MNLNLLFSHKALYCALVTSILEYGSVVLGPHCADLRRQLEGIQSYMLKISCPSHDYSPVLSKLNVSTLTDFKYSHNIPFLTKPISSNIEAPSLLLLVNFKVSSRFTRNKTPFHIPFFSTNYRSNETINRSMKLANERTPLP